MTKTNPSLTKNSIYYLLYNVLNVVFPFVTGIYVARVLLPTEIGEFESARNLAQYFIILAFLGIPTYGLREIAKNRDNQDALNKLYTELMIINTISTAIFLSIYCSLIFTIPIYREHLPVYLITGLGIALNFLNNSWLFEGCEQFRYISIRNIIFKVVSFILLVTLVRKEGDYLIYAAITVIGTAGNYILNFLNSRRFVHFSFSGIDLKRHLKPIFYLAVVNLAIEIYSLTDITMLNIFCEKEKVAYYSYSLKIQKILLQIINTFTMVLVPRIAIYYKENKFDDYHALLTKTLKIILIIGLPIIVGLIFVSDFFIPLIYGEQYIASSNVLKILSVMLVISPVGYLLGSRVMLVSGNEHKMFIPVLLGAVVNVILNYFLINLIAEVGAALASLASELVVMGVYIILSHKHFKLLNLKHFIICEIIALGLMALFLFGFSYIGIIPIVKYLIMVFVGAALYFLILVILKEEVVLQYFNAMLYKLRIKKRN